MKVEIITIGDELLIGQIVDTNSSQIGEILNDFGLEVSMTTSIHDDHDQIIQSISEAEKRADIILITGGLGPTKDDITKKALCDYFNCSLVENESVKNNVKGLLKKLDIPFNSLNAGQYMVPEKCIVLPNKIGTAPGMLFEKDNKIFISMPGVPKEMYDLMNSEVLPFLKKKNVSRKSIFHKKILLSGISESSLSEKIESWETSLPSYIKLAYLPNPERMCLRLSAYGDDKAKLKTEVSRQVEKLKKIVPEYIFGYDEDNMAGVVGKLLMKKNTTVGVAESCTGGNIAHFFTSNSGSSDYFKGGVVSYTNEIKKEVLGVKKETLDKYTVVSREVSIEMAEGAKRLLSTDYAISTTGFVGPTGGTKDIPMGTVWIAVAGKRGSVAKKFIFTMDRKRNIVRASQAAINMLRLFIISEIK
ncbi:MAG: competence/damage-inducible protein A [Prolixibacteraceae bacterium]|nr:competence/damage-inducible protein A [Prolixibacteraceae bacterium]